MSLKLLLGALVRETAMLLATVATYRGGRLSLAQTKEQLFRGLADGLQRENVSRKLSADMLGMVPRAFKRKVARAEESVTDRGRCLWEAVYDYVATQQSVTQVQLMTRFNHDDGETLRGVLADLRESGVVQVKGRGPGAVYRITSNQEISAKLREGHRGTEDLVWTFIYHDGPVTRKELNRHGFQTAELESALDHLLSSGRIETTQHPGADVAYRAVEYQIPSGSGFEGAILDHFHGVVRTLTTILKHPERPGAVSTYQMDVWTGHPMHEEVRDLFREMQRRATELRTRIDAHNLAVGKPEIEEPLTIYFGLCKDIPSKAQSLSGESPVTNKRLISKNQPQRRRATNGR